MEINKLIKAKEKGKLIIEGCTSTTQLQTAKRYVDLYYKNFNDLVSYSELNRLINNKYEKLNEMESLKNVMYAGLGLIQHTDEKLKEQFDALVIKGKKIDEEGKNLVNNYFKTIEEIHKEADEKFATQLNSNIEKVQEFLNKLKSNSTPTID
jgi:polyhydroxyalkanoate synthesis regulator phasin